MKNKYISILYLHFCFLILWTTFRNITLCDSFCVTFHSQNITITESLTPFNDYFANNFVVYLPCNICIISFSSKVSLLSCVIVCVCACVCLVFMCKCMSVPMYKQTRVQIACTHIFMRRREFGAISLPKLLSTVLLRWGHSPNLELTNLTSIDSWFVPGISCLYLLIKCWNYRWLRLYYRVLYQLNSGLYHVLPTESASPGCHF